MLPQISNLSKFAAPDSMQTFTVTAAHRQNLIKPCHSKSDPTRLSHTVLMSSCEQNTSLSFSYTVLWSRLTLSVNLNTEPTPPTPHQE